MELLDSKIKNLLKLNSELHKKLELLKDENSLLQKYDDFERSEIDAMKGKIENISSIYNEKIAKRNYITENIAKLIEHNENMIKFINQSDSH